ncbi:MAG: translation initiation factor [Prevotellaceae bacterium]|jgi:translation initiation factor 1|nr:translation initiation factor [Prevotellaceae bacterium]
MPSSERKERLGVVYSTNPDFGYKTIGNEEEPETQAPQKQRLLVGIDRRQRAGKQVTLVSGFVGKNADLEALGKLLKNRCGAGGAVKDGVALIQGDFRDKIVAMLLQMGYQAKRSN